MRTITLAAIIFLALISGAQVPSAARDAMQKIDAEDGASDEEFFGDVIGPSSGEP